MDLEKFKRLFLEEATEHLAEMSQALLSLEKDLADREAIDLCFRMAHSIKGMAGSLDYDAVTELAHAFEDCMDSCRSTGRVAGPEALGLLFRGLEGLEAMVDVVRRTGESPGSNGKLTAALAKGAVASPKHAGASQRKTSKKKVPDRA